MSQIVKIFLLIGLAIVTFALGIIIARMESKTCLSRPCKAISTLINNSLNTSINPCTNFYQFVCGSYNTYNTTKPGRITNIRDGLEVMAVEEVARVLDTVSSRSDDPVVQIAKSFYQSCVDLKEIEYYGFCDVTSNILLYKNGFPLVMDDWKENYESEFNTGKAELDLFCDGFIAGAFLEIKLEHVHGDFVAFASVPQETFRTEPDFNNILHFYMDVYKAITNADPPEDKVKELRQVVQLKVEVSKVKRRYPRQCPVEPHIMNDDLEELFEDLDQFEAVGDLDSYTTNFDVSDLHISMTFIDYLKEINTILTKNENFKPVAANFIILEYLTHLVHLLPKNVRDSYNKYMKDDIESNDVIVNNRALYCAQLMKNELPNHLAAHYLQKNQKQVSYDRGVRNVIEYMKKGVISKLKKSTWISKDDRSAAISKVNKIKVVTPLSRSAIKLLTTSLSEKARNSVANYCAGSCVAEEFINIRVLGYRIMSHLKRPYDIYATDITFDRDTNLVVIPFLYLSFPLVDKYWPKYITFGVMGSRLSIAIWKSLDFDYFADNPKELQESPKDNTSNNSYDNDPFLESDKWSAKTMETLSKRSKCILAEYNDFLYQYIERKLNNTMCVAQLPSEILGVQSAYIAYNEYHESRFYNEPSLNGLNQYTNDVHFFIDLSTYYCKKESGTYVKNMTDYEIVSFSDEFNLNQMLRNNDKFIKAFDCKRDNYMSSANKCSLF